MPTPPDLHPSTPTLQREFLALLIEHGEQLRRSQRQLAKKQAADAILLTLRKLHTELKG